MKILIRTKSIALSLLISTPALAVPHSFDFSSGFSNGGVVPDGAATGWSDTRILSGIAENTITDLDVTIEIAGGWNGDLYAYLTHSTGFSVLLNRSGVSAADPFGYSDAGLNVRLNDSAANGDIHLYQSVPGYSAGVLGGEWAPDGRGLNPLSVTDTDPRNALLSSFNGLDPNGSWTLFVADLSSGEAASMVSWGLRIDAETRPLTVPDAGNTVLLFGMALGSLVLGSIVNPFRKVADY
jgi:subtilisin-like proprotein convertase family protein